MIEKKLLKDTRCIFIDLSYIDNYCDFFIVLVIVDKKTSKYLSRISKQSECKYIINNAKDLNKNHGLSGYSHLLKFDHRIKFTAFIAAVCRSLVSQDSDQDSDQGGTG